MKLLRDSLLREPKQHVLLMDQESLVAVMRSAPFSVAIDWSIDSGVEKMNPLTVRIFNERNGSMHTQFLDMCMTSQATAEGIFSMMDKALEKHQNIME